MQVFLGTALLRPQWRGSVVCIGTFDGVHLGHRQVVSKAVELARSLDLPPVLVTFDRHPAATLAPHRCPAGISSLSSNLKRFEELGVALSVVLEFGEALAHQTAEQFWEEELQSVLKARAMVVGHDFAFGRGRTGTPEWLSERVETVVIPPFEHDGKRVSSSQIRNLVSTGQVEAARELLGRPFASEGVVVAGAQLGRQLGYPTANLALLFNQVVPADGVYAGTCQTPKGTFLAAASVGNRATVGGQERTIEAFLLDYPGESLYGMPVLLNYQRRLRGQETFGSVEALKRQMGLDVEETRRCLSHGT